MKPIEILQLELLILSGTILVLLLQKKNIFKISPTQFFILGSGLGFCIGFFLKEIHYKLILAIIINWITVDTILFSIMVWICLIITNKAEKYKNTKSIVVKHFCNNVEYYLGILIIIIIVAVPASYIHNSKKFIVFALIIACWSQYSEKKEFLYETFLEVISFFIEIKDFIIMIGKFIYKTFLIIKNFFIQIRDFLNR